MRYLFVFLLILSDFSSAYSQKIHFGDLSNKWGMRTVDKTTFQGHILSYKYWGVTFSDSMMIDGLMFHGLKCHEYNVNTDDLHTSYIYDDTVKHKVFIDDTLHVLYDWNLKVGDTFSTVVSDNYTYSVNSIDSIQINNDYYKVFYCYATKNSFRISHHNYVYIEGIGSINCPDYNIKGWGSLPRIPSLVCFENKGQNPTIIYSKSQLSSYSQYHSLDLFTNPLACGAHPLTINKAEIIVQNITVHPQPASENVTISFPKPMKNGKLYIHNTIGQLLFTADIFNTQNINYNNTNGLNGVYYYSIISNDGTSYKGKLVFQ